jgi:hypothetical protein
VKKILREAVSEVSESVCNKCGKPAVSSLIFTFGYGSDDDLEEIHGDFCNKHGSELRKEILKKYKLEIEDY